MVSSEHDLQMVRVHSTSIYIYIHIYIYTHIYIYIHIYIYYPRVLTMDPFTRSQLAIHQWLPMALLTDRGAATEFAAPGAGSANDLSPKLGPCRVNWRKNRKINHWDYMYVCIHIKSINSCGRTYIYIYCIYHYIYIYMIHISFNKSKSKLKV